MSEIILIESKSSEEFKSLINYNLMIEYINSGEEKKNELLNEYKEKFMDINKIFQGKISKKFSLIENCKNLNLENDENFLILNKKAFQDIYEDTGIVEAGYNAAILQEALGNLSVAESMMIEVYDANPDSRVAKGLTDIRNEIGMANRLKNQIQSSDDDDFDDLDF